MYELRVDDRAWSKYVYFGSRSKQVSLLRVYRMPLGVLSLLDDDDF
jgi:hypothetical protein